MGTISGVLALIGFLPYAWAIVVNHNTAPSPVSWTIWASVDILALIAMKKKKAETGQLTGGVIGASTITLLAFFFGKPTMGIIEWASIVGAIAGITLWQKTGNANLAIICAQIATLAGAFPTFAHGYNFPAEENPIAWVIWFSSCIFALLAVRGKWDLENALQPITWTIIETVMVVLVVIRPHL